MSRNDAGDGDACPQDRTHGRMWAYPVTRHQFCPHSEHRGEAIYEWDGLTPKGPPRQLAGVAGAGDPRGESHDAPVAD